MTELLRAARKILAASDDQLTPEHIGRLTQSAPVQDVCYMLAHERHRRGLRVRMVRG